MRTMMKQTVVTKAFLPEHSGALSALPWWSRQSAPVRPFADAEIAQNENIHHQRPPACCEACGRSLTGSPPQQGIEVLSIRAGWRRRLLLRWDDIQALSCESKYINITDNEGLVHVIEDSLDRLCAIEGAPFVRIHRSHAIHPAALSSVVSRTDGSCEFLLKSGATYPGSRRQSKTARVAIFGEAPRRRRGDA